MRCNKEIAKLTADAASVKWPQKEDRSFYHFKNQLHDVLQANDIRARGMEFDPEAQDFYWTEEFHISVAGYGGTWERTITLDPKLPIDQEIARIKKMREDIYAAARELDRLHYEKQKREGTLEDD